MGCMNDTQTLSGRPPGLPGPGGRRRPTGLVLAADLLARGITTRIIDKGDGVNLETRAIAIHARALEVLDMMGLAERFVDHGQVVRRFSFYTDGRRRLSLDLARNGTRFGFMLDIPQHHTETPAARAGRRAGRRDRAGNRADRPAGRGGRGHGQGPGRRRPAARDHRRLRGRLRRRAQPGPPRARPHLPRSPLPAGLAAGRRPAGLGPARGRGPRLLPGRRRAAGLLPDARAPVAAGGAVRR